MEKVNALKPSLIVVDAPLALLKGCCFLEQDCECSVGGHFQEAELELRSYGSVPLTFREMKILTMRGISLSRALSGRY